MTDGGEADAGAVWAAEGVAVGTGAGEQAAARPKSTVATMARIRTLTSSRGPMFRAIAVNDPQKRRLSTSSCGSFGGCQRSASEAAGGPVQIS